MSRRRTYRRKRGVYAYPGDWIIAKRREDGVLKVAWLCSRCQGLHPQRQDTQVRRVKQETAREFGVVCVGCDCKA